MLCWYCCYKHKKIRTKTVWLRKYGQFSYLSRSNRIAELFLGATFKQEWPPWLKFYFISKPSGRVPAFLGVHQTLDLFVIYSWTENSAPSNHSVWSTAYAWSKRGWKVQPSQYKLNRTLPWCLPFGAGYTFWRRPSQDIYPRKFSFRLHNCSSLTLFER